MLKKIIIPVVVGVIVALAVNWICRLLHIDPWIRGFVSGAFDVAATFFAVGILNVKEIWNS
jgi:hypothetical protein